MEHVWRIFDTLDDPLGTLDVFDCNNSNTRNRFTLQLPRRFLLLENVFALLSKKAECRETLAYVVEAIIPDSGCLTSYSI